MTTHPIIDRLATLSSEELTVSDVVFVLGLLDRKPVDGLIKSGELEAQKGGSHARGKDTAGRDIRHRYTVAAAAVLTYLVKITSGDKAVILEAIHQRFPHHHALCERIAHGLAPAAKTEPSNVIPMNQKKGRGETRRRGDENANTAQMQLFEFPVQAKAKATA